MVPGIFLYVGISIFDVSEYRNIEIQYLVYRNIEISKFDMVYRIGRVLPSCPGIAVVRICIFYYCTLFFLHIEYRIELVVSFSIWYRARLSCAIRHYPVQYRYSVCACDCLYMISCRVRCCSLLSSVLQYLACVFLDSYLVVLIEVHTFIQSTAAVMVHFYGMVKPQCLCRAGTFLMLWYVFCHIRHLCFVAPLPPLTA